MTPSTGHSSGYCIVAFVADIICDSPSMILFILVFHYNSLHNINYALWGLWKYIAVGFVYNFTCRASKMDPCSIEVRHTFRL